MKYRSEIMMVHRGIYPFDINSYSARAAYGRPYEASGMGNAELQSRRGQERLVPGVGQEFFGEFRDSQFAGQKHAGHSAPNRMPDRVQSLVISQSRGRFPSADPWRGDLPPCFQIPGKIYLNADCLAPGY